VSWWAPTAQSYARTPVKRVRPASRTGDRMLFTLCAAAAGLAVVTLAGVVYEVIHGASPSISHFGLGFLGHTTWKPNAAPAGVSAHARSTFEQFGAGSMIYGTAVTSAIAILIAGPLGVAIALYLSMIAPPAVRVTVGPVVEMLAAVPSIIMGLWGVFVLAPFIQKHVEPGLHSAFGFIPLFGAPQTTGLSLFTAGVVLSLMILPIVAALSRDLFLTVPRELTDGAAALGATRWEIMRGIVLPSTASGVAAATVLALGRALGEAIAVLLVVGDLTQIHPSWFRPGTTLASLIANEFQAPESRLHVPSLYYLALVLLVMGLLSSLIARAIGRRFDVHANLVTT
jgi:phosphate transport system permease protein